MSMVLRPIPDSSPPRGLSLLWTLYAQGSWVGSFSLSFQTLISYEHSWFTLAVGPLLFLPADLVCLSGEELDHCCGCSSSLSATILMALSGEELVHCCHHVSVQIIAMYVLLCAVSSAFIVVCAGYSRYRYKVWGNVQVRQFMLGERRCAGMVLQPCYYG